MNVQQALDRIEMLEKILVAKFGLSMHELEDGAHEEYLKITAAFKEKQIADAKK